jgi:hypothetical protein
LNEILADSVVRTLMERDGIGIGDIRYLVDLIKRRQPVPKPLPAPDTDKTPTPKLTHGPTHGPGTFHNESHVLRTPLNAILGFAWMIEKEVLGPIGNARYRAYARHIGHAGETLLLVLTRGDHRLSQPLPRRHEIAVPAASPVTAGRATPRDPAAGDTAPISA